MRVKNTTPIVIQHPAQIYLKHCKSYSNIFTGVSFDRALLFLHQTHENGSFSVILIRGLDLYTELRITEKRRL